MNNKTQTNESDVTYSDLSMQINRTQQLLKSHKNKFYFSFLFGSAFVLIEYSKINLPPYTTLMLAGGLIFWSMVEFFTWLKLKKQWSEFESLSKDVQQCLEHGDLKHVQHMVRQLNSVVLLKNNTLLYFYAQSRLVDTQRKRNELEVSDYKKQLTENYESYLKKITYNSIKRKAYHPLTKVERSLRVSLRNLRSYRTTQEELWEKKYENLSWWGKLTIDGPDFTELDKKISKLEMMQSEFEKKHKQDLKDLNSVVNTQYLESVNRLKNQLQESIKYVDFIYSKQDGVPNCKSEELLASAGFSCAMGISFSLWGEFMSSHPVYDALRKVNTNYADMSDLSIWFDTLFMSDESFDGLVNLTKGAYFEILVEEKTQGQLFEHFNNPSTDIKIDGIEYQIKATDSVSYINSVDNNIPVITTSEVAELTDTINSGISNTDLTTEVESALTEMPIDLIDTITNGLLAGIGGLGIFATINGINHAAAKHAKGDDGFDAALEGLEVAITGTAKSIVDLSEMTYKALSSKPSKVIGRKIVKSLGLEENSQNKSDSSFTLEHSLDFGNNASKVHFSNTWLDELLGKFTNEKVDDLLNSHLEIEREKGLNALVQEKLKDQSN